MNELLKKMLRHGGYMDQADDGTGGAGGAGGSGDDKGGDDKGGAGDGDKGDKGDKSVKGDVKKPTDEEARLLKENMQKKDALKKAADENAALAAKLKQFEGIDPEAVKKMLAEQKSAEEKELERKGDYERLKQRMAEEHGKETASLKAMIDSLQGELGKTKGTVNELSIGAQFGQSKFISEEMTMTPTKARVVYADHFDLEDGKVVGYDKPRGAANRTALVDQYGNAVSFDEAMRKIVDADPEKDYLLKSKTKPGANSDSKKVTTEAGSKGDASVDSVSKIASGLKGLKIGG
jgi:hypothetical protein